MRYSTQIKPISYVRLMQRISRQDWREREPIIITRTVWEGGIMDIRSYEEGRSEWMLQVIGGGDTLDVGEPFCAWKSIQRSPAASLSNRLKPEKEREAESDLTGRVLSFALRFAPCYPEVNRMALFSRSSSFSRVTTLAPRGPFTRPLHGCTAIRRRSWPAGGDGGDSCASFGKR